MYIFSHNQNEMSPVYWKAVRRKVLLCDGVLLFFPLEPRRCCCCYQSSLLTGFATARSPVCLDSALKVERLNKSPETCERKLNVGSWMVAFFRSRGKKGR